MAKIVQTAGRNALGEFAPEFAHFNDDVLFGENWNNNDIDVKTRSIITVVALMAQGITDSSLKFHLQNAKDHGVSQKEIAAVITHVGFYAGWPKAWAVFNLAKEVWNVNEGDLPYEDESMRAHAKSMVFPIGQPNDAFAQYFIGHSYLFPVSTSQVGVFNVTFEPEFAHFNDDVLFGENWNNEDIDLKTRSIITVVALMAQGITDSSLKFHLQNAKDHGVTQKEIAAIITHIAFYAGWPKGWAVFNLAKEVWNEEEIEK